MLQSTDPEMLSNKKGFKDDTRISLGRGNRITFVGGLGVGWNGNRRDQVEDRDGGREYEEMTGIEGH